MGEENKGANKLQEEKVLQAKSGFGMLVLGILLTAAGIAAFVWGCIVCDGKGADLWGLRLSSGERWWCWQQLCCCAD